MAIYLQETYIDRDRNVRKGALFQTGWIGCLSYIIGRIQELIQQEEMQP